MCAGRTFVHRRDVSSSRGSVSDIARRCVPRTVDCGEPAPRQGQFRRGRCVPSSIGTRCCSHIRRYCPCRDCHGVLAVAAAISVVSCAQLARPEVRTHAPARRRHTCVVATGDYRCIPSGLRIDRAFLRTLCVAGLGGVRRWRRCLSRAAVALKCRDVAEPASRVDPCGDRHGGVLLCVGGASWLWL